MSSIELESQYKSASSHIEEQTKGEGVDTVYHTELSGHNLGTLQGFDAEKRQILNPQPSNVNPRPSFISRLVADVQSPEDPLNWSPRFKQYLAALSSLAVLCCNITGAGPSIAIVQQTIEWFGAPPTSANISKTAYVGDKCSYISP